MNHTHFRAILLFSIFLSCCAVFGQTIAFTEIRADANDSVTIEIENFDDLFAQDISEYWIWSFPVFRRLDELEVLCGSLDLGPGESVTLRGFSGVNPEDGELAMYNRMRFGDTTSIVDYVLWGDVPIRQATEVAIGAGMWIRNDLVPSFQVGRSIQYDGEGNSASDWSVSTLPSICMDVDCIVQGGRLSLLGDSELCGGNSGPDVMVRLDSYVGRESYFVVTDEDNVILFIDRDSSLPLFAFRDGTSLLRHVATDSVFTGLEIGNNLATDLLGCFDISNSVSVTKAVIGAGTLTTLDDTIICAGDRLRDFVFPIRSGAQGVTQWAITSEDSIIVRVPDAPPFEFHTLPEGTYLIWSISSQEAIDSLPIGNPIFSNLSGCYDISPPLKVVRIRPYAGNIDYRGQTEACLVTDQDQNIELNVDSVAGLASKWIVADTSGLVLMVSEEGRFDFSDFDASEFDVFHLASLEPNDIGQGGSINNLEGCFSLSNAIAFMRSEVSGGTISTTSDQVYCGGQSFDDTLSLGLMNEEGQQSVWLVLDMDSVIIDILDNPIVVPSAYTVADFLVVHLSFDEDVAGLEVGSRAYADLIGCYSFSNILRFVESTPEAGQIEYDGDTVLCMTNGNPLEVSVLAPTLAVGSFRSWVWTDTSGLIVDITEGPMASLVSEGVQGLNVLRFLTYEANIEGLTVGAHIDSLRGCFDRSDSLLFQVNNIHGGVVTLLSDSAVCVGEGVVDSVILSVENRRGADFAWIITEEDEVIQAILVDSIFDLERAGTGVTLFWHISFQGRLEGLEIGDSLGGIMGCYALSRPAFVRRDTVGSGACVTTSIATNLEEDLNIAVFPNPFSSEVILEVNPQRSDLDGGSIVVSDLVGKRIFDQALDLRRYSRTSISSMQWEPGVYYLTVQTKQGHYAQQIVKVP